MAENNNGAAYFILGMGVGVVVGLLVAPKSGEETRQFLRQKATDGGEFLKSRADEGREYVTRTGAQWKDSAADLIEKGKETLSRQKEQISQAVEAGKQAYREAVSPEPHAS